jgi:hypothetical protein
MTPGPEQCGCQSSVGHDLHTYVLTSEGGQSSLWFPGRRDRSDHAVPSIHLPIQLRPGLLLWVQLRCHCPLSSHARSRPHVSPSTATQPTRGGRKARQASLLLRSHIRALGRQWRAAGHDRQPELPRKRERHRLFHLAHRERVGLTDQHLRRLG